MNRRFLIPLVALVMLAAQAALPLLAEEAPPPSPAPGAAPAQGEQPAADARASMKPVVQASFAGVDQAAAGLDLIGRLSGNQDFAAQVGQALRGRAGVKDLPGLDPKRPWGLMVETNGQELFIYAFVPVADLKQLLAALEPAVGKPEDAAGGALEIEVQGRPLFVKEKPGGWAVISVSPAGLDVLPADPVKLLDGLNQSYDLAVRVTIKNLPPLLRQMVLIPMQIGVQQGLARLPGESDQQHAQRVQMANRAMQWTSGVVQELDTVFVGLKIDQAASTGSLDVSYAAVPGTKTAAQMASLGESKTNFAGFLLPEASVQVSSTAALSDSDKAQMKNALALRRAQTLQRLEDESLNAAEFDQAKQLLNELMDMLDKTVDTGRSDSALSLLLDNDPATVVAASNVADGGQLEKILKREVEKAIKEDPKLAESVHLDAEEHQGVHLHTASIPVEKIGRMEVLAELFGGTVDVVVGIDQNAVYVGAGRDAMATLKAAIDKSKAEAGKQVPSQFVSVALASVAKRLAAMDTSLAIPLVDAAAVDRVLAVLQEAAPDDRVVVTTAAIPNGGKTHVELQKGVLKAFGLAPKPAGQPVQ